MAVKFIIANSPSSRLCWLTQVDHHQRYHLLSYAHLTSNLIPDNALRNYLKKERSRKLHGYSFRVKAKSPPPVQHIKYAYFPNLLIREEGLPPARLAVRDLIRLVVERAGEKGISKARLLEIAERKVDRMDDGRLGMLLSSMMYNGRLIYLRHRKKDKICIAARYMTEEERDEIRMYLKKNRAVISKEATRVA